tara:strand:- start:3540 stop:5261 length:1722 start_codon:yes stop_codon:yes gene_type:complete
MTSTENQRQQSKNTKGVLGRLRTSKDTSGQEGPAASEETEVATTVEEPAYKQTARRLATDLKKDGTTTESWEAAKQEVADRGARYRDALQSPDAWKRDIDASRMAEFGDVGDVVGAKDSGFEEEYDATTEFQEEEYGGGSLERESLLAEILGQEYRTEPDPKGVEGTITDPDLYEKYYFEAQEKTPWAQKEQLQDAAIKGVMAEQAERAASAAKRFPKPLDVEATETVGGGLGYEKTIEEIRQDDAAREAAAKKETPVLSEGAQQMTKGGPATKREPTDAQKAARIAMQIERDTGKGGTIDYTRISEQEDAGFSPLLDGPEQPPLEGPVDETVTESAPQELFNKYSGRQRASILAQPGGSNFTEALENLSKGNLQGFNEAVKGGGYKDFRVPKGKRSTVEKRFVPVFNDFLERVPPDLKASVVQQLEQKVSEKGPDILEKIKTPIEQTLYEQVSDMKGVPTDADETVIKEFTEIFANHYFNAEPNKSGFGKGSQQVQIIRDFMEALGASPTWGQSFKGTVGSPGIGLAPDIFANNPTLFNELLEFGKSRMYLKGITLDESPVKDIIVAAEAGE